MSTAQPRTRPSSDLRPADGERSSASEPASKSATGAGAPTLDAGAGWSAPVRGAAEDDAGDDGSIDDLAPLDVRLRGVRVTYFDAGPRDAPAVVMLHALGADRRRWHGLARALLDRHRVIALDFPGFGASERADHRRPPPTYESLAETVLDLVAALDLGRVTLIGHSMGAGAALVAAADRPEFVERLVLVAAPLHRGAIGLVDRLATAPVVGGAMFRHLVGGAAMRRRGVAAVDWADAADATWSMLRRSIESSVLEARLSRVRAPTLLVWGRDDRVAPSAIGARLAREIRGARLEILECGHAPEVERPAAFIALIEGFLAATVRTTPTPAPTRLRGRR